MLLGMKFSGLGSDFGFSSLGPPSDSNPGSLPGVGVVLSDYGKFIADETS